MCRRQVADELKHAVEDAFAAAVAGAVDEHRQRRAILQQALERIVTACQTQPQLLATHLQLVLVLGAMADARCECLWALCHAGEVNHPSLIILIHCTSMGSATNNNSRQQVVVRIAVTWTHQGDSKAVGWDMS